MEESSASPSLTLQNRAALLCVPRLLPRFGRTDLFQGALGLIYTVVNLLPGVAGSKKGHVKFSRGSFSKLKHHQLEHPPRKV